MAKVEFMNLVNETKGVPVSRQMWRADRLLSRMVGLLTTSLLSEEQALWIDPCNSIHTFFMRFPIDVVFVAGDLKVKKVYENVKPWRFIFPVWGACSTIEMPVGAVHRGRIEVGDQLHVGH